MSISYPIEILGVGRWIDRETFVHNEDGLCRTRKGGSQRYDLPERTISDWGAKSCRYLPDGRTIKRHFVPRPHNIGMDEIAVYVDKDLSEAAPKYREAERIAKLKQPPIPDDDNSYLTAAQLARKLKVTRMFCQHWRNKPSILRAEEMALRSCQETRPEMRGGAIAQFVYRLGDARAILEGKERTLTNVGSPSSRKPGALMDTQACEIIRTEWAQGCKTVQEAMRFAREKLITRRQFVRVRDKLRMVAIQRGNFEYKRSYLCLPGQSPPKLDDNPVRREVVEFLQGILAAGERLRQEVVALAKKRDFNPQMLHACLNDANVVSRCELQDGRRVAIWHLLSNPKPHPSEGQPEQPDDEERLSSAATSGRKCKKRGRPTGWRDPKAAERDRKFKQAWLTGNHSSASELGLEFDMDPSYARKLKREAESENAGK
jgi:hypothetical protein